MSFHITILSYNELQQSGVPYLKFNGIPYPKEIYDVDILYEVQGF